MIVALHLAQPLGSSSHPNWLFLRQDSAVPLALALTLSILDLVRSGSSTYYPFLFFMALLNSDPGTVLSQAQASGTLLAHISPQSMPISSC